MAKKGQVTAFMIIGIVLIIVVALVFLARNQIGIGVPKQQFLDLQLKSIQDEVNRCVDERAIWVSGFHDLVRRRASEDGLDNTITR